MFDFGLPEFIFILIVGLIAVGPEEIPGFLFKAGRLVRRAKLLLHRANNAVSDVMHELEVDEYRKTMKEDILDFGGQSDDEEMTVISEGQEGDNE